MAVGLKLPGQHQAEKFYRAQRRRRAIVAAPLVAQPLEVEALQRLDLHHLAAAHWAASR